MEAQPKEQNEDDFPKFFPSPRVCIPTTLMGGAKAAFTGAPVGAGLAFFRSLKEKVPPLAPVASGFFKSGGLFGVSGLMVHAVHCYIETKRQVADWTHAALAGGAGGFLFGALYRRTVRASLAFSAGFAAVYTLIELPSRFFYDLESKRSFAAAKRWLAEERAKSAKRTYY